MPDFDLLSTRCLHALEWNQAYKSSSVQGRVEQPVSHHRGDQRADWLVNTCLSIVSLCKDLYQSALV